MAQTMTSTVVDSSIILRARAYVGRGCHGPVLRAEPKTPGKLLQCRANSEDFGKKLLPRFILSDELYEFDLPIPQEYDASATPPTPPPILSSPSALLSLPIEILSLIYQSIDHAPTQIALALTCKRMAQVAAPLDLNLSTTSPRYAGILPREVFDVPALMQSLTTWLMPPHLRLCAHCLTMRPANPAYWADVDGCERANMWITKTGWHFESASWHRRVHDICPACHVSCSMSDHVDCDGCRVMGRMGDVDWLRVSDHWRRRNPLEEERLGRMAEITNPWDLNA